MSKHVNVQGLVRATGFALALAVASTLAACRESEPEPELGERTELSVVELGRIGGRIYNEPDRAEDILEENGLTTEEFETRVRAITNDSAQSAEYTRGFEEVAERTERPAQDSVTFLDSTAVGNPSGAPPR